LERYGELRATVARYLDASGRSREGAEYWLNEGQALLTVPVLEAPR
jgi:hypothetical protein